jgi:hypothetical protein
MFEFLLRSLFLRKKWVFLLVLMSFFSFFIGSYQILLPTLALSGLLLWLHRRDTPSVEDEVKSGDRLYIAPVGGSVETIVDDFLDGEGKHSSLISIQMGLADGFGLYLPCSGEMIYLKQHSGEVFPRQKLASLNLYDLDKYNHTELHLQTKSQEIYKIFILKCERGFTPRLWLKSGDRGKIGSCFGHIPFGGSVIVLIPKPNDILVYLHERVSAHKSVLSVKKKMDEFISLNQIVSPEQEKEM